MINWNKLEIIKSKGSFETFVKSHFESQDTFIIEAGKILNELIRTDLTKAKKTVAALSKISPYCTPENKIKITSMRGRYSHWTGDYKIALKYYIKARKNCAKLRRFDLMAESGKGLMDVYMYLGDYDNALKYGKASLKYFRKKKQNIKVGQVLNNIGNIYHRMDTNKMALSYYNKALEIFKADGGIPSAVVQYNMGNIYTNMNRVGKAEELYRNAARIYNSAGMKIAENQAYYSIAYLYFLQDRFSEAISIFEEVHTDFEKLGDTKSATVTRMDMAEIDIYLNQYGAAGTMTDRLIEDFKKLGMRYEEAKTNYFAFTANFYMGNNKKARQHLIRAEKLFIKENNNLWLGMVAVGKSRLYLKSGKNDLAYKQASLASGYFRKSGDRRREIDADLLRLNTMLNTRSKVSVLNFAGKLKKSKLAGYQRYELYRLIGDTYYRNGEIKPALNAYKSAVRNVERMLAGLYPDEIKIFFTLDKYYAYKMVVECLLKLGRTRDSYLASLKGLAVINQKATLTDSYLERKVPENLISQRRELLAAIKRISKVPAESIRYIPESNSFRALEQKLWLNERKIRSHYYGRGRYGTIKDKDWTRQLRLNDDETVLNYVQIGGAIGVYCVNKRNVRFVPLLETPDELNIRVRKLQFIMESSVLDYNNQDNYKVRTDRFLNDLYECLIAPVKQYIMGEKLIILAEESLSQIPFCALTDGNNYLYQNFRISRIVNPVDLADRKGKKIDFSVKRNAIFAVSDSDFLPSIDIEAGMIARSFKGASSFTGHQATKQNLKAQIADIDGFLHIAAHASRSSENPVFSRILLDDGPFYPFDLFDFGLKCELVTLSGCQTAAPGLYYGNSFSLAKAFYQAGSGYVLATLWPVADKISMYFMINFYESLSKGNRIREAFRLAQQKAAENTNSPAHWGAFVLIGF